ncbi:Ribosomal RNA large subunit methyltransferase H, partial [Frankliniella fusca]
MDPEPEPAQPAGGGPVARAPGDLILAVDGSVEDEARTSSEAAPEAAAGGSGPREVQEDRGGPAATRSAGGPRENGLPRATGPKPGAGGGPGVGSTKPADHGTLNGGAGGRPARTRHAGSGGGRGAARGRGGGGAGVGG